MTPGQGFFREIYDFQRRVGAPLTYTALLAIPGFWQMGSKLNDEETAKGADVWPQVSCRKITMQLRMSDPFQFNQAPSFAALLGKPREARLAAYRDRAWREHALEELGKTALPPRWDSIEVAESERHAALLDRRVAELAQQRGATPLDVMLDLSLEENLETRFRCIQSNDDEAGIAHLLRSEHVVLGLSDAGAHVGQLCDAPLPTDLLGNWVRERGVLSLEEAVASSRASRPRCSASPIGACCAPAPSPTSPCSTPARRARPAAPRARLPGRRRPPHRRPARGHAPRARERHADPQRWQGGASTRGRGGSSCRGTTPREPHLNSWPVKTREVHNHHFDSDDLERPSLFRADDIVISTYAKSGTTWVQQIVGAVAVRRRSELAVADMSPWLDLRVPPKEVKLPLVEAQTHRRFLKTHLPVDALVFSPRAKYLYIGRDGRDVVWSMYNHHANANQFWYDALNDTPGRVGPPIEPPPPTSGSIGATGSTAMASRSGRSGRTCAPGGQIRELPTSCSCTLRT